MLNVLVKLPEGKTTSLQVENVSPVRYIQELIETTESVPANRQTIKVCNVKLYLFNTISSYNSPYGCTTMSASPEINARLLYIRKEIFVLSFLHHSPRNYIIAI